MIHPAYLDLEVRVKRRRWQRKRVVSSIIKGTDSIVFHGSPDSDRLTVTLEACLSNRDVSLKRRWNPWQ